MKKSLLLFSLAAMLFSCSKQSSVTVSGKIDNPVGENVIVKNNFLEKNDTIALAEDGTFTAELALDKECLAYLSNGNLVFPIYLVPGASLNFTFNIDDFKSNNRPEKLVTGEGSEPSELLYELSSKKLTPTKEMMTIPVNEFTARIDSVSGEAEVLIKNFEAGNKGSKEFIDLVALMRQIEKATMYNYYISYHPRFAPDDKTEIPASFQETIDGIPTNQFEKYRGVNEYVAFVTSHFQNKLQEAKDADTTIARNSVAYYSKSADLIAALEAPEKIKQKIANSFVSPYTYMPDSIQQVIKSRYKELITDPKSLAEFEDVLATLEKTQPGSVAPSFNYEDIDGNMVSSESLKGKVVYIDVWATWCGPCRGEIPSLKKMEEEMHDQPIAFVSISIDDDKEAWQKMVKNDGLQGYQLYADGAWNSSITKNYAIRGIPRFIMIDKDGKIVNANASRPSNPETRTKLMELAAK